MTWTIDKEFSFCYGHRVWVQRLNPEYTEKGDTACKCRHLHGHEGSLKVFLEADELDDRGMVVDFKELGWFKTFIDDTVDHKFIVDSNDPMFRKLVIELYAQSVNFEYNNMDSKWFIDNCLVPVVVPGTDKVAGYSINMSHVKYDTPEYETLEGFFIVNFVPTSEMLSRWVYELVDAKMSKMGVKTKEIWWNETPKSRSIYKG